MIINYHEMITLFSQVIWALPRISGLFLTLPVISSGMIPPRIKLVFIMLLAFLAASMIPERLSFLHFKGAYIVYVFSEFMLGLLMGFVLDLVFQVFILGGQIIAMQAGLGFATMVDPASHASVPLVSQLYMMIVFLIFLSLNGHLVALDALLQSFKQIPVGELNLKLSTVWTVVSFSGWMFKEAVLVSIPAILSLLIVSLSFGVMARVAPQLNIFSIGFPVTLLMGVVIIRISLPGIASQITDSLQQGMQLVFGMLR